MRRPALFVLMVAALLALVGASVVLAGTSQRQVDTINVSGQPVWLAAPLLLAQDKGYFAKRNLNVNYTVLAPNARFAALQGGSNQIIDCPTVGMLQAVEAGFKFSAITPQGVTRRGLSGTAVLADSPIKTLKDLEGKTMAVATVNGTQDMADKTFLSRHGVDYKKVNFIAVPTSGMVSALEQGRVDAADLTQPFLNQAKALKKFRILYDSFSAYGPYGAFLGYYCTTPDYLAQNATIIKNFTAAILQANKYANAHPREAKLILKKVNPALTDSDLLGAVGGAYPLGFNKKQYQNIFDMAFNVGLTKQRHVISEVLWSGAPIVKPVKK